MSERKRYGDRPEAGGYDDSQNYGNSRTNRFEAGEQPRMYTNASRSASPPPHHTAKRGSGHESGSHHQERKRSKSESGNQGFHDSSRGGRGGSYGRGRISSRGGGGRHGERDRINNYKGHNQESSGARNSGGYSYSPPAYAGGDNKILPKNPERRSESIERRKRRYDGYKSPKDVDNDSQNGGYADSKIRSGDRVPDKLDPELREVFPFRVFIKDEYLKEGLASKNEIEEIIRSW